MASNILGRTLLISATCCGWRWCQFPALANPAGATVVAGTATVHTSGSQETITASAGAYINWNSFNIGAGETTTFVQPSANSVVFNNINGGNPSQILGYLNANGYVILQNQAGFYVGGEAAITAHGLIMTTASGPTPNLVGGGAWEFDAPPPTAKIVNYGQININGGGSAYLIASDIENNGTISAPGGNIGLYAGEQVLISSAPDGRGLSAVVTLPQGSVDNNGKLIADAGTIAAQAQTVNQNGLVQANSVQNVNGMIELLASDSVNLGANSAILAKGDSTGVSAGGSVTIQSSDNYSDQAGSAIDISGGAQGGNGGQAEISAPNMSSFQTQVTGAATDGFANGAVTIDPANVYLSSSGSVPSGFSGYTGMAFSSFSGVSINVTASQNIAIAGQWNLANETTSAMLTLIAGNSILLNNNAAIIAGNDWTVSLNAGSAFVPTSGQTVPNAGSLSSPNYGIYLGDSSYIQTQNGNISITALNEVQLATDSGDTLCGIQTLAGGNIMVEAMDGSVNTGDNPNGFVFNTSAPNYYSLTPTSGILGGISTAAGGNVTINAGGNVTSYFPSAYNSAPDAGTGTFGPEPGNLTINAGGNVIGNYVVANGSGTITAGGNIGSPSGNASFVLSLISGSWNVSAANGNIYLGEVLNPNAVYNDAVQNTVRGKQPVPNPAKNLFTYGPDDSVTLDAQGVIFTGAGLPRQSSYPVQEIYPPILNITAGSGGVTLDANVTLFPSVDQALNITTTDGGGLFGVSSSGNTQPELLMSDSSATAWTSSTSFSATDHSSTLPVQAGNPNPVIVNVSGNMENLTLITSKVTEINVGGDMDNCAFSGQNLNAADITSITVGGQIYNTPAYVFLSSTTIPSIPSSDLLPGMADTFDAIFTLALDPSKIPTPAEVQTILESANQAITPSQVLSTIIEAATVFGDTVSQGVYGHQNTGFVYNSLTGQLGYEGQMLLQGNPNTLKFGLNNFTGPFTILTLVNGQPVVGPNGQYETTTVNWVDPAALETLYTESQADSVNPLNVADGYRIGGPGQFVVNAGSISLGNSYGIVSCGVADNPNSGFARYGNLASVTPEGASLSVTVVGDLDMLSSTIATLGGGNVTVNSDGTMELGSPDIQPPANQKVGYGIFSAGPGDVSVTAAGDIDIDGSRIATYDGGDITVESFTGDVNLGSVLNTPIGVFLSYVNPEDETAGTYAETIAGNGVFATTPTPGYPAALGAADKPGNITVSTPQGDINGGFGGITQIVQGGMTPSGPTVTLIAGTFASGTPGQPGYSPGYPGNIILGSAGVIASSLNVSVNGNFSGVVIATDPNGKTTINAAGNFNATLLAAGSADVGAGGSVSGTIVGVGSATVSGGNISAQVLSQSAKVGGDTSTTSTLGTAKATSTSQSAAQQASSSNQELANNEDTSDEDQKKKKKSQPQIQRIKRVTVILPKET